MCVCVCVCVQVYVRACVHAQREQDLALASILEEEGTGAEEDERDQTPSDTYRRLPMGHTWHT